MYRLRRCAEGGSCAGDGLSSRIRMKSTDSYPPTKYLGIYRNVAIPTVEYLGTVQYYKYLGT